MEQTTIYLAATPLGPIKDGTPPERLLLLREGDNPAGNGDTYRVDTRTYAALSAQIDRGVFERLVIDYDHESIKGHPNYKPNPRSHAGYGKLEIVEGEGVYLSGIEWTEEGKAHLADYPDLSPALYFAKEPDADGAKSVRNIVSVAVCTNGLLANGPRCLSAELSDLDPESPADTSRATCDGPAALSVDRNGREHVEAGVPEGGQFAPGEGALSKETRADYKKGFRTSHLNPRHVTAETINTALKDSRWAYSRGWGSAADKKAHKRAHFELQRDLHRKAIKAGLTYNAKTHLYE